ncbi:hypothetical protein GCM10007863_40130 [Dyella mobilis]|nr:hypothetical protein GCM10007863_40130 [Dyella mobilis]
MCARGGNVYVVADTIAPSTPPITPDKDSKFIKAGPVWTPPPAAAQPTGPAPAPAPAPTPTPTPAPAAALSAPAYDPYRTYKPGDHVSWNGGIWEKTGDGSSVPDPSWNQLDGFKYIGPSLT